MCGVRISEGREGSQREGRGRGLLAWRTRIGNPEQSNSITPICLELDVASAFGATYTRGIVGA